MMRTFLDEGAITFDGEYYKYAGLFTFARPVQKRLPIIIGAMRGPKSFELAGEVSDGVHHALSYSKEAYEYLVEHTAAGAKKAGRDVGDLDIGVWTGFTVGPDSAEAKRAARQPVVLLRLGDAARADRAPRDRLRQPAPVLAAMGAGDIRVPSTPCRTGWPTSSRSPGTPDECVAKIRRIADTGVNHMILCVTDPILVKTFTGRDMDVPDVQGQLKMIADKIMPAFN